MKRPDAAADSRDAGWRSALAEIDPRASSGRVTQHAAAILASRGLRREAVAAYRELLNRTPDHVPVMRQLVNLLRQQARPGDAEPYLRRLHEIETADMKLPAAVRAAAEQFMLAAEGLADAPAAMPEGYVEAMFDGYAERFDRHLTERLAYRGPQEVHSIVTAGSREQTGELSILDAGCGTGLAAPLFRPLARRLDGIDLSPGMIERARERGLYDRLEVGGIVRLLEGRKGVYDLILAADVFVYVGDLRPMLAACYTALVPSGRLAFTVESDLGDGYRLQPKRRYAHSPDYIDRVAAAAGLSPLRSKETALRTESGKPVVCHVRLFARP